MSLRVIHIDKEKNEKLKENEKKIRRKPIQYSSKNVNIPKADIDMLVLDKYEKEIEQ